MVAGVEQVEPGCLVEASPGFLRTRRYWSPTYPPPGTPPPSDEVVVHTLRTALAQAVQKRIPDGPTGLLLSGGLGSTAIASMAGPHRNLPAYAVNFADDPFPEAPFAGRVAHLLGLELHEVTVATPDLMANFEDAVKALGHPVGHPAVLLQLPLARAARKDVGVVLAGNGGESLFGGRHLEGLTRDLALASIVTRLPTAVMGPVASWLKQSAQGRRVATPPSRYALELGLGGPNLFSTEERTHLLRDPELVQPDVRQDVLGRFHAGIETDPINLVLHGHLRSTLGERALTRANRTAAAVGLDIRFPLLDTAVVEAATSLPGTAKIRRVGGQLYPRWPLRQVLDGVLPDALLDRPKRSWPVPLGTWLAGPGRLLLERRFQQLKADPAQLWNPDALDALRRDVTRSNAAGNRLWTLFVFDAWLRNL